ncbi:hypothetical protein BKA62DRAFT_619473 [Auriculariales sp. MPI-PUGE-AT-0066]|nr:hypothetical protein BKA62DRAFT_619473 [Auriculariales sp. MPI-PUGE-AT-0066]
MSYNLFRAKALRANHRQARVHRHDFTFQTTSDELGALIGFLAAIGSNALPANLDPTETLNPDVVLEFNARSLHGAERVREHVQDVWAQYPVVILSEVGRGDLAELTRGVKRLFALYKLKPLPMMLDIDLRDDKRVLKPLLYRLTGLSSFPLILIGGHPILDVNSVFSLDKAGALAELLRTSGAIVGGSDARRKYE